MKKESLEKCERIDALVKDGLTQDQAIKKVGLGHATYWRYKARLDKSTPKVKKTDEIKQPITDTVVVRPYSSTKSSDSELLNLRKENANLKRLLAQFVEHSGNLYRFMKTQRNILIPLDKT